MEKYYQKTLHYIHQSPNLKKTIIFINKYFPYILFFLYPILCFYLLLIKSPLLFIITVKPCCAFLLVTIFRKIINRPRPYETMDITPLFQHKHGQSFPSRHALCAIIISLVCFNVHVYLGLFCLFIAIMICIGRILAGVHYISDVLAAIIIAMIIYFI